MKYIINLVALVVMMLASGLAVAWNFPIWLIVFNVVLGLANLMVFVFNNKFDKTIAAGFVFGSCIGIVIAEVVIRPPMINHLWTANVMLLTAILLGTFIGEIEK